MRTIIPALLLALSLLSAARAGDSAVELEDLGWLTGRWLDQTGESSSEHIWTRVRGGTLLGLQRDIGPDGRAWVEFVNIHETPDGIVFTVIPPGQAETDFALVSLSARRAVFENPEHDYPRRIVYWLENDDILAARIEGVTDDGPRASEWRWRRADP